MATGFRYKPATNNLGDLVECDFDDEDLEDIQDAIELGDIDEGGLAEMAEDAGIDMEDLE